jgi:lactoylglutathione lyase
MRRSAVLALVLLTAAAAAIAAADSERAQIIESKLELFVSNPAESIAFYSVLGFHVVHEKPDGYTTLMSGSTVIALSPLPWWLPAHWLWFLRYPPIGTEMVLYAGDLEQSRASLEQAGHSPGPIALQSWGDLDFRVTDPDGYYVRISEGSAVPLGR